MGKTLVKIGPADHGRRMSLDEFEHAKVREGYIYELSRGIITVSDIPNRLHLLQLGETRKQLYNCRPSRSDRLPLIASGSECKLLIPDFESERHPDLSLYLIAPPPIDDASLWHHWFPEIVIEVVSPESRKRDYQEKPEEYLSLGAEEYWIVDARYRAMIVMRRMRERWIEYTVQPPALYETPLLPGLEFSCGAVFDAAGLT